MKTLATAVLATLALAGPAAAQTPDPLPVRLYCNAVPVDFNPATGRWEGQAVSGSVTERHYVHLERKSPPRMVISGETFQGASRTGAYSFAADGCNPAGPVVGTTAPAVPRVVVRTTPP